MAIDEFKRYYHNPEDFPLLVGPVSSSFEFLKTGLQELPFNMYPSYVEQVDSATVLVHWPAYPGEDDLLRVKNFFDAFVTGVTSDAPIEINNWDPVLATTQDVALAIDHTSPPLKTSTYQVILNAMHRMQADTPAQGSRLFLRVDRSDGGAYEQNDHTMMSFTQAVNLPITFTVTEGQTIRVRAGVALVTGAGGAAVITGARATIDRI